MKKGQVFISLSFTEPVEMYFNDVRESYFDTYRGVMNPYYKDPNGKLYEYSMMKKRAVYHHPFYNSNDEKVVSEEARKCIMPSDKMWSKARKLVDNMGRTPVQVKINFLT